MQRTRETSIWYLMYLKQKLMMLQFCCILIVDSRLRVLISDLYCVEV